MCPHPAVLETSNDSLVIDDVYDPASLGFNQRRAAIDYNVLISGWESVFRKFTGLENIRDDCTHDQFEVGRPLNYDWIRLNIFSHYGFLVGRDHDILRRCKGGSSEKNGRGDRASKKHLCLLV